MATGNICGSKLYGCAFSHDTLYICHTVGEELVVKQSNSSTCKSSNDGGEEVERASNSRVAPATPPLLSAASLH